MDCEYYLPFVNAVNIKYFDLYNCYLSYSHLYFEYGLVMATYCYLVHNLPLTEV